MRQLAFTIVVSSVLFHSGCVSEDSGPIYLDMSYQVRCVRCEPRAPDNPVREIAYLSGEQGFGITCNVAERAGKRVVTMKAEFTDPEAESRNHSLRLRLVDLDGKDPGEECQVTVIEGGNTYEGGCTAGKPDKEHPCKVSMNRDGDEVLKGSVKCISIANKSNSSTTRHVVAPLTTDEPAEFTLYNCSDL